MKMYKLKPVKGFSKNWEYNNSLAIIITRWSAIDTEKK